MLAKNPITFWKVIQLYFINNLNSHFRMAIFLLRVIIFQWKLWPCLCISNLRLYWYTSPGKWTMWICVKAWGNISLNWNIYSNSMFWAFVTYEETERYCRQCDNTDKSDIQFHENENSGKPVLQTGRYYYLITRLIKSLRVISHSSKKLNLWKCMWFYCCLLSCSYLFKYFLVFISISILET